MKEELALVGLNWSRDAIGRKEQTALTGQESISFTTAAASTHDFSKQAYIYRLNLASILAAVY